MEFRDLETLLGNPKKINDPYISSFLQELNRFHPKLWEHMELTASLSAEDGQAVIAYLLELYCQCQNHLNIELGAAGLMALPQGWLATQIEAVADKMQFCPEEKSAFRDLLSLYPGGEPRDNGDYPG